MSNRAAAERTVADLRSRNALDEVEDSLVEAFLSLASAVDDHPEKGELWREYRAIGQEMREAVAGGSDDDTAAFLVSIQTPRRAKVVHPAES